MLQASFKPPTRGCFQSCSNQFPKLCMYYIKTVLHRLCTFLLILFFLYRHLYYSHGLGQISRMNLDGSSDENVVGISDLYEVSGIAVDHRLNVLYWALNSTDINVLRWMNMTEWDDAHKPQPVS